MTAQHTPGPWTLDATADGWTLLAPEHWHDVCSFDATEEDARLIAAAPLMLEALTAIEDAMGFAQGDILTGDYELADGKVSEARHAARAAIRAATGEDA